MALINDSIYQNAPRSLIREGLMGYDNAMKAKSAGIAQRGLMAQQNEYTRSQEFNKTLGQLAQMNDHRTPEGQQAIIRGLGQKGFGAEAMELAQKFPKQPQPEFETLETDRGLFNKNKGTGAVAPLQYEGKPLTKPAKATPERFQLVKNKRGQMESVDVSTGLNAKGQPVDAWQDPQKPEKSLGEKDVFGMEQQLRTQYLAQTKDFRDVRDAFGRIKVSSKTPSAAGDLSLIFNYMKMLDPGSTVREGEFATAAASGSLGDRFVAAGKKLLTGERLDPSQRADFLARAQSLYSQQLRQNDKAKFETRKMASSYPGLNPDRILMDADLAEEAGAEAPASGMPTHDQYDALPSGAEFTDPQGNVRRKP